MKITKFTVNDVYFKMIQQELKENKLLKDEHRFIYFSSYYINKFLHTDLNIKSYIGLKKKDKTIDVFVITCSLDAIKKNKDSKKFFYQYFEEGIKNNERYIGIMKTPTEIGFIFKHDEELLNAYRTGQYSKISDFKKNKMKKFKVIDFDTSVGAFYIVNEKRTPQEDDWKEYPLGKKDKIIYELYKMIYPENYYKALSEQFNVKIEFLKKNKVEILPKPNIEKEYLEVTDKEQFHWFDMK